MKKICMSFVFMFSVMQLSASENNSIISTMAFTTSVAFVALMQQPTWVNQLQLSIEKTFEKNDTIINVVQVNVDSTNESLLISQDQELPIDAVSNEQKSDDESQNVLPDNLSIGYTSLDFKNPNYVDYDEEVHSLLSSSSMVYVRPSDYSQDIAL